MNGSHPVRHRLIATVISVLVALSTATVAANPRDSDASAFALYATIDQGQEYRPLDPLTLDDMAGAEPLTFEHEWPQTAVSADGSTFVTINSSQGPLDDWIRVQDGVGGPERLTITPAEAVFNPRLSADGARLVVQPTITCGLTGCGERTWHTYDTRTGELVSTIKSENTDPVWPDMIDPAGTRLYDPFHEQPPLRTSTTTPEPGDLSGTGPWPLQIAAYDLGTGEVVARTTVPEVFAGSWQTESIDQMYVGEMLIPAIALSPDGSRIAVVDAAVETLTLLDSATLEVVETHSIHESEGIARRLLGWLGIAPETARAKVSEGRSIRAAFSADGQHLYLTGHEIEVGETVEEITGHGLGLLRIDVRNGEITARAMEGHDAETILPAPDGRSVYVLRPERPWWDNESQNPTYILQRLDAETLSPLAQRPFTTWPQVMLVPAPSTPG